MLYTILFLLAMTLPGAALTHILRLDACRTATSIALSLSVLVVALLLARVAGLDTHGFGYGLLAVYLVVAGGVLATRGRLPAHVQRPQAVHVVPTLTFAAVAAYMLWAGPYTEVPSDAWWHIGRINDRLEQLAAGNPGSIAAFGEVFDKLSGYWYTISAFFVYVSGADIESSLPYMAAANTLLFCAAVYAFALYVFDDIVDDRRTRHWVAAASVLFFFGHFGLSVFSYVRYYVYAPTVLTFVIYLSAVACFIKFVRHGRGEYRFAAGTAGLALVAAMLHTQEAAFIVVMAGAVLLVEFARVAACSRGKGFRAIASGSGTSEKRIAILLGAVFLAYVLVHAGAHVFMDRHNPLLHARLADIRHYIPFLRNLYILKPTGDFYQVVTVWGVLVYILFLARASAFIRSPYLVAGMAVPFLTVFNPVFTDLFLRFSWPEVLWRMCYMLPLPFVGGYFLVRSVAGVAGSARGLTRAGSALLAAALLALLLPFETTYFISPHSKIYTLAPVTRQNDHRQWQDLLDFLDGRAPTGVVTDPVTGYVVNGVTRHTYGGYKFYDSRALAVDKDWYRPWDFRRRDDWLVVVNRRDGTASETGRSGGHWPADIMQVSGRYSKAFLRFVSERSGMFEKLWSRDRIDVYRVREPARNSGAASGAANRRVTDSF